MSSKEELGGEKSSENAQNQDDLIIKQQEAIAKEITTSTPLMTTPPAPLSETLLPEYLQDPVYTQKITKLAAKRIRRTRPDGNCFYRAFCFSLFEKLIAQRDLVEDFLNCLKNGKKLLEEGGYSGFTVEDFYDNFLEVTTQMKTLTLEELVGNYFTDAGASDYLICFLRILTAAELKKNAEFYSNFIETGTLDNFIQKEVEPMFKESDHIHIVAITAALGHFWGVNVLYLDRGQGEELVEHSFKDGAKNRGVVEMLYRPGHYDLIYS